MAQKINEVGGKEWLIVMIVVLVGGYFAYKHETLPPPVPDKTLYLNFCKQLITKATIIDKMIAPFEKARAHSNVFGATKYALEIKGAIIQPEVDLDHVEIPEYQNQKITDDCKKMKDEIVGAYISKQMYIEDFIDMMKEPNAVSAAKFQNQEENSTEALGYGIAMMLKIAKEAGMTESEVKELIAYMKNN